MTQRRSLIAAALIAAIFPAVSLAGEAGADYPTRPVRMIVPFAPGGASDFVGRILQPAFAEQLRQQVVVDNRPGAGGNIGVQVAATATPDGYTFLLGNIGTMAINANVYTHFPVKPLRDLEGITQVVDVPGAFVVHPSVPAKNVKELVAYLKANPGKLNYGSASPSSASTLEMTMFLLNTGTTATQVNYKGGAGPAMIGVLAGETQMMMVTFSSAVNFAKQGKVRMVAVITPERIPALPEVPTMREQGYDMVVGSWQGIYVPKGTPRAIQTRLFEVAHTAMKDPTVVKRLGASGVRVVTSSSPAAFRKFWESEHQRFAKAVKAAGIEPQ